MSEAIAEGTDKDWQQVSAQLDALDGGEGAGSPPPAPPAPSAIPETPRAASDGTDAPTEGEGSREAAKAPARPADTATEDSDTDPAAELEKLRDELQKPEPEAETPPKPEAKPAAPAPTRQQKDAERRDTSWKALNAKKEAADAREVLIAKKEEALAQKEEALRQQREQSNVTPEMAEQAAAKRVLAAQDRLDAAETEAARLEDAGDFDKAESLRTAAKAEAAVLTHEARQFRAYGEKLRQAPAANRMASVKAEWDARAFTEFKELEDTKGELYQGVAKFLVDEPEIKAHPKGIYYAAKLKAAELASSRVPSLEEENTKLKTEVERLRLSTAAPGAGAPAGSPEPPEFDDLPVEKQISEIKKAAKGMAWAT